MRAAFVRTLVELAREDRRILLLTGDLGYMALEPFAEEFPDRFFNVGVAEQNMVGLATGLAEAGWVPWIYSIATFATLRPLEFIRNGPVLHELPVRLVGMGGGLEYGPNGPSHYALEDLGVLRTQPSLAIVAPADHQQVPAAMKETSRWPGPVYFRLGKDDRAVVPGLGGRFEAGRVQRVREGRDLLILATGSIAVEAEAAAALLAAQGVSAAFGVVACLNPPPAEDLAGLLGRFPVVLTVEAHYRSGGLGSLVCETAAENGLGCRVVRCAVGSIPPGRSGSVGWLHQTLGLSREALVRTALLSLAPSAKERTL